MTRPSRKPGPATGSRASSPPVLDPSALSDTDQVVFRVLSALRGSEPHEIPPPRLMPCQDPLPRRGASEAPLPLRTPGQNPMPRNPWPAGGAPLPVIRDAASIAQNTTGYFRGWRRGWEAVVKVEDSNKLMPRAATAALARSAAAAPRNRFTRRRRAPRLRPTAMHLIGLVIRILPELERPRYGEEFRAELSGLNGLHQLAYATRLLLSAPALRRSLRAELPGAAKRTG
jgi:hypothetical protein